MNKQPCTGLLESIVSDRSDVTYHFDQVIIHSYQRKDLIKQQLPIDELKKHCIDCSVQWPKDGYKEHGYMERLSITAPSSEFLTLLQKYESIMHNYVISKVEVAKDIIVPNSSLEQLDGIIRNLHKSLTISYAKTGSSFDVHLKDSIELDSYDPDKGGITSYIGNKSWKLVTYARISKLTGENCLHTEWRYLNTTSVKKKTGICTIEDLIRFDLERHWQEREKSVRPKVVDRELFGKFLVDIDGRIKLNRFEGYPPSRRMRSPWGKAGLAAMHYLSDVKSVADFKQMIADWKKEIKQRCGTRSAFDKRILKVNPTQFLKPLDIK